MTHAIDSHPVALSPSTVAAMRRLGIGEDELELPDPVPVEPVLQRPDVLLRLREL